MSRVFKLCLCALLLSSAAFANTTTFVVMSQGPHFDSQGQANLEAKGATVIAYLEQIGVAIVQADASFANENISGVQSITADVSLDFVDDIEVDTVSYEEAGGAASPPFTGDDDFFFDLQWGHTAIQATDAWAAGARGAGVRVAVLDGGIDSTHPDLVPNLNTALSTSFVPGEAYNLLPPGFSHGSHVAGTIGAADNGFGTIGVAPEAELVVVKVLSAFTGSGSFAGIIQGIVYAADIDADVINMSLGVNGGVPHNVPGAAALFVATGRATTYAYQQGSTVIVAAGNDGTDLDHDGPVKAFPGELPHVIAISATAPVGWGLAPATTNLDNLASYSNFGQSAIHFGAPGGDFLYAFINPAANCTIVLTRPCFVLDFVFSTSNGGWSWSVGTSMAAPHASGVAALIIGQNGGDMHPAQVEAALRAGAEDLGKPGKDDVYGNGRVNALNSIQ